jgi:hypothetical protein
MRRRRRRRRRRHHCQIVGDERACWPDSGIA